MVFLCFGPGQHRAPPASLRLRGFAVLAGLAVVLLHLLDGLVVLPEEVRAAAVGGFHLLGRPRIGDGYMKTIGKP